MTWLILQIPSVLMETLEKIQYKFSKTKLVLGASMLPNRTWKMTRDKLTHNYFKWDQLWVVK
ncbi:DUF4113 domain-containing protein [Acinetobacter baumannii]|nr:DUF4113 domain-containing protein [Acinetobacter baumannii]